MIQATVQLVMHQFARARKMCTGAWESPIQTCVVVCTTLPRGTCLSGLNAAAGVIKGFMNHIRDHHAVYYLAFEVQLNAAIREQE